MFANIGIDQNIKDGNEFKERYATPRKECNTNVVVNTLQILVFFSSVENAPDRNGLVKIENTATMEDDTIGDVLGKKFG